MKDTKKRAGWKGDGEAPFLFLETENTVVDSLYDNYGLLPSFPRENLVVRDDDDSFRHIYAVSDKIKEVLKASNSRNLRVINTGVRIFAKSNIGGAYRISNEGIQTVSPFLNGKRELSINSFDLQQMMKAKYPKFDDLSPEGSALFKTLGNLTVI